MARMPLRRSLVVNAICSLILQAYCLESTSTPLRSLTATGRDSYYSPCESSSPACATSGLIWAIEAR